MVGEIVQEMAIEKLGPVITIKAAQGKRQPPLNGGDLRDDAVRLFVPGLSALRPAGVDAGEGEAPHEFTGQRMAAVGDGIGLDEPGLRDIPVFGADGNLTFE